MKRSCLAVVLLVACGLAPAQQPGPAVIHVDVNLVQVDAVVTDAKGKHVSNLKAEDFVILQDGKPQTIANFSYIAANKPVPAPAPTAIPASHVGWTAPAPPPVAVKPAEVRRTFALVVDDLGLAFNNIAYVRDALRKFVDRQMQPGDLVAIIRTSGGLGVLQQFTTDKSLLHAAIDRVKFANARVGVDSFAPVGETIDPHAVTGDPAPALVSLDPDAEANSLRTQMFTVGTLGAVQYVIDGLRDMPGRKSVVLFSESMQLYDLTADLPNGAGAAGAQPVFVDQIRQGMRRLVDAANRAAVVIYTIDPRGVVPLFPGAAASISPSVRSPGAVGKVIMDAETLLFNSREGLWTLAEETGGLFIHDDNYIDDAISQAIADSEGYYLIGYHPDSETFDAKTGDPKFHTLKVKLKTAGLQVRSRSGFFGESDKEARNVPRTGHQELLHALTSPFSSGDVPVRLTTLFGQAEDGRPYLSAMLHIDPQHLKFTPQADGGQKANLEVVAMTFGESGQPVDQSDRHFNIALNREQYAAILSGGLVYRIIQPLQKAGMYQVRVALRDEDSGQLGSANQFMETPDLTKGRLALSSILLAEDAGVEGRVVTSNSTERIFQPGAPLSYRYTIFNAQGNAGGKTDLQVQTRIFRDGKLVHEGRPMAPDLGSQTTPKRLTAGGNMVLAKAIPPGDYVLQVIVTDKLAKQKYQSAAQSMDFEIRP